MFQKLHSPCRAELLRISSPTNSSHTSARRANKGREEGGREGEGERERERERDREGEKVR